MVLSTKYLSAIFIALPYKFFSERESDEYTDNMMILRKRGQLLDLPDGGARIKFSPTMPPITIPPNLRFIPIESWNKVDQVWLNM